MKKIILFLAFTVMAQSAVSQDHDLKLFFGAYYYQADGVYLDSSVQREITGGGVFDLEHTVVDMPFVGSHASLSLDGLHDFVFTFGLSFRFHFYDNFLRLEVLPPMLYIRNDLAFVRPMGIGIRLGKGRFQINIRELLREGYLTSQLTLRLRII